MIAAVRQGDCVMAEHIDGPLYYERMGRTGPVMAFVHPNPMDQSCWIFQMAHMSTWFRCIAIDMPGYGRSPKAQPGLTMDDMAQACWEAIDEVAPGEPAILVGCSVGSALVPLHASPSARSDRGADPLRHRLQSRARSSPSAASRTTSEHGIDYRWGYTFEDLSPAFRATPLAHVLCRHVHRAQRARPTCRRSSTSSRRCEGRKPRTIQSRSPARRSS